MTETRRRGADLENAILDAAWEELVAVGSANLTMDGVAARAKTSKAVLYRRWPHRLDLLTAAVERRAADLDPAPAETGSLRGDVLAVLAATLRRYQAVPDAPALHRRTATAARAQLGAVLQRASRQPAPRILTLPLDLLEHHLFVGRTPVTDADLAAIVDEVYLPLLNRPSKRPGPDRHPADPAPR